MAEHREGKLILCPTPIGNLGDITPRTLEALKNADVVCCEDTRVTGKLLRAFDISCRLERLDEVKISTSAKRIIERVLLGERIAYCSDAGMPGVSDPGLRLVDEALDQGACVEVLPGASAVTLAFVASGFSCQSFYFGGFFPRKGSERTRCLEQLKALDAALIFYESPRRIVDALRSVARTFPHRRVAVCRELTKIHEEVVRGQVGDVLQEFSERLERGEIKGEVVFVIDAKSDDEAKEDHDWSMEKARARLHELKASGDFSKKDMVKRLQKECGLSRNEAYDLVHGEAQEY